MQSIETTCGHFVKILLVQSRGGHQEGRWQVRVSGPSITLQCGFKCLYADANLSAVVETVAEHLGVDACELRKPLARPPILVGLDVETSDWDDSCSFTSMSDHFNAGFPCHADHKSSPGYVCGFGYSVFRPTHNGSFELQRSSNRFLSDQIATRPYHVAESYRCSWNHGCSLP